jgi:hypothetical protein
LEVQVIITADFPVEHEDMLELLPSLLANKPTSVVSNGVAILTYQSDKPQATKEKEEHE